jgi:hypothetical protein
LLAGGRIRKSLNEQPSLIGAPDELGALGSEGTSCQNRNACKTCLRGANNRGRPYRWKVDAQLLAGLGPLDKDAPALPVMIRCARHHRVRPLSPFDRNNAAARNDHRLTNIVGPQRAHNGKAKRDVLLLCNVGCNASEGALTHEQLWRDGCGRHDRKAFLLEEAHNPRQHAVVTARCNDAQDRWEAAYEP